MRKLKLDLEALTVTSFDTEAAPEHTGGTINARMADTTACQETMAKSCEPTQCDWSCQEETRCGFDTNCCEYTWHMSCLPNNPCDSLGCFEPVAAG
jgi:hypothetical protein